MWNHLYPIRLALQHLRRNPGFTVAVVLTLALAIGANTAVFSIANALLLRHLPYAQPERLATIYAHGTGPDAFDGRLSLDDAHWELLRGNVPSLISAISAEIASGVNVQVGAQARYLRQGRVSAEYFNVLQLRPLLGRTFTTDEDLPHGPRAVVLSFDLWRSSLAADPQVIGKPITLKGEAYTVVGVLPASAITPLNADLYTPLQPGRQGEGGGTNFQVINRLREGATWPQAQAELNRAWTSLPQRPGPRLTFSLVPLQTGQSASLRPQVLILMLAAGLILLIACANLAGLTLVRLLRRTGEMATRLALGASRWQLQKQLWLENLLLALLGGAAGLLVGFGALHGLLHLLPEHFLPVAAVPLDGRVLGFALALSLVTSVLFGMLPAFASRRLDLRSSMNDRSGNGAGGTRLRQCLIAGEVALTVVLLAAAGLLTHTLVHLETLPPGFNPTGVLSAKASLDDVRYHDPAAFRMLLQQSTAAMRQIPGVSSAAVGLTLPFERALNNGVTLSDGAEAGQQVGSDEVYVTPGYFATLQIPLLAGRDFNDADGPNTQPVVLVNQAFVRRFFHGNNPLGRSLNHDIRIVGVVADTALSSGLTRDAAPLTSEETIYIPAAQMDTHLLTLVHTWFQPSWIVRSSAPVSGLSERMQHALAGVDPNLPFSGFYSMQDLMRSTLSTQRIEVWLLGTMASLALLLSALGIFGLVGSLVAHRTREIGIRIALGSTIRQAIVQIGASGVIASAAGLALGLLLCLVVLRTLRSALYGVTTYDATTLATVILVLSVTTLLAATLPALRIARIDPASTLRGD